jgi:hypothetical protein
MISTLVDIVNLSRKYYKIDERDVNVGARRIATYVHVSVQ